MSKLVVMPKIGVNMTEAVVTAWLVKEGDAVLAGQDILTAETDKATQEIPSLEAGVVGRILALEGETVACQQPILILLEEGETPDPAAMDALLGKESGAREQGPASAAEPQSGGASVPEAPQARLAGPTGPDLPAAGGERVRVSPLARKAAKTLGVDVRLVKPARPGARIVEADVRRFAEGRRAERGAPIPTGGAAMPLSSTRRAIARGMSESARTKPAVALTLHADASGLQNWRRKSAEAGREIKYNEMLIAIAARALREFPSLNASMDAEGTAITPGDGIHIGLAVDARDGLVVPVVFDADRKSAAEIRDDIGAKVRKIRDGRIELRDISGATFTVSNLGMYGVEQFDAIINPPQCAILAVGAIVREPVVKGDAIVIGERMALTLVFDHRIVDGAPAARFLARIKELTEDPMGLLF